MTGVDLHARRCDYKLTAAHAQDLGLVQVVGDGMGNVRRHGERLASCILAQSAGAVANGRGRINWQLLAAEAVAHLSA